MESGESVTGVLRGSHRVKLCPLEHSDAQGWFHGWSALAALADAALGAQIQSQL